MRSIYLDYNASTPIAPEVATAMEPYLREHFGNPSSDHWAGRPVRAAVERARAQIAELLGSRSDEVIFTSGGTEANNHALKGVFFAHRHRGTHIVTTQIEHPAVLTPCQFLETLGAEVTRIPVNGAGLVDPEDVRRAITPRTILVSVMHANNEVGTIQPIAEIAHITRERGVLLHTDAAQSAGKISVRVNELGVDLLSIAGHKFYAPKGVGALYVRGGVELESFMHGAGHESGRRAGTESALLTVGLGAACALVRDLQRMDGVRSLRELFWNEMRQRFGEAVVLNGHPERRLPNTLNVSFVGHRGAEVLERLEGVAASTGSACHSGQDVLSPVLSAMHVPLATGLGAIRFSLGRATTTAEIQSVLERLTRVLART